jgi:hypothetical protein
MALFFVADKRNAFRGAYSGELYQLCAASRLGNSISTGKVGRHFLQQYRTCRQLQHTVHHISVQSLVHPFYTALTFQGQLLHTYQKNNMLPYIVISTLYVLICIYNNTVVRPNLARHGLDGNKKIEYNISSMRKTLVQV